MPLSYNIPDNAASFYSTAIERIPLTFRFKWETRNQAWYIDIVTQDGFYLAKGNKLIPNMPLITQNIEKGPSGNIYVVNNTNLVSDNPTRNNIGPSKEFELVYLSEEELQIVSGL